MEKVLYNLEHLRITRGWYDVYVINLHGTPYVVVISDNNTKPWVYADNVRVIRRKHGRIVKGKGREVIVRDFSINNEMVIEARGSVYGIVIVRTAALSKTILGIALDRASEIINSQ